LGLGVIPIGIVVLFIGSAIPTGWADAMTQPETKVLCQNLRSGVRGWWDAADDWHPVEIKCIVKVAE
jgi:hypothetical protein